MLLCLNCYRSASHNLCEWFSFELAKVDALLYWARVYPAVYFSINFTLHFFKHFDRPLEETALRKNKLDCFEVHFLLSVDCDALSYWYILSKKLHKQS